MQIPFPDIPILDKFINFPLLREPLNWAIVFVFASISLLAMHSIMQAFGAMQSTTQPAFGAPGQINIAPPTTGVFSQPGVLADSGVPNGLSPFVNGPSPYWTDGAEAKFAEDGWVANP